MSFSNKRHDGAGSGYREDFEEDDPQQNQQENEASAVESEDRFFRRNKSRGRYQRLRRILGALEGTNNIPSPFVSSERETTQVQREQPREPRISRCSIEQVEEVSIASYVTPQSLETDPIVVHGELVEEPNEDAIRMQAQMLQQQVNALRANFSLQPMLVHAQQPAAEDLEEIVDNLHAELQELERQQERSVVTVAQVLQNSQRVDGLFLEETSNKKKKRVVLLMAVGIIIILVVIAVAVGVPLLANKNGSNTTLEWQQLGQHLAGKATKDTFGRSVSLSHDGNVIAVGADQFLTPDARGYVSVFRYNTQSWTPMGQVLFGNASGATFGWPVSLNGDGTTLAVGAPFRNDTESRLGYIQVYEYEVSNNIWTQLGNNIDGQPLAGDRFAVSLSDAGDILAVGTPFSHNGSAWNSGSVRLFQYNGETMSWTQLGQTLVGQAPGDEFGYSVSLSRSGMIVGVGARRYDGFVGVDAGQTSVYQYNAVSFTWVPMGLPIKGDVENGRFGTSVSLEKTGMAMAVGTPAVDSIGKVSVFDYNITTSLWTLRGEAIVGEEIDGDRFGRSVSLSQGGNVVAIGSPRNDATFSTDAGQVRIYKYDVTVKKWRQVGENINAEAELDGFGLSVSLSGNGTVVGIGAWAGDANRVKDSGYVKVFTVN